MGWAEPASPQVRLAMVQQEPEWVEPQTLNGGMGPPLVDHIIQTSGLF